MTSQKQQKENRPEKKRGNKAGLLFFQYFTRIFGLSGAYRVLYIVCLYYLIFDRDAVEKAGHYIKHRFPGCSKLKYLYHVYLLFVSQGKQLIDRYAHNVKPELFEMRLEGSEEAIEKIKNLNTGCIILTSHIGNWQLGMGALKHLDYKKLHILMRPENNKAIQKTLALNPTMNIGFISALGYLGGTIEVINALEAGDIVSIMGDRSYGTQTVDASFLGEMAGFPYSAFYFAAKARCPIVTLYVVKEDNKTYSVHMNKLLYPKLVRNGQTKAAQLQTWVQEFVNELEGFAEKYPYQCFLFNDIWNSN